METLLGIVLACIAYEGAALCVDWLVWTRTNSLKPWQRIVFLLLGIISFITAVQIQHAFIENAFLRFLPVGYFIARWFYWTSKSIREEEGIR